MHELSEISTTNHDNYQFHSSWDTVVKMRQQQAESAESKAITVTSDSEHRELRGIAGIAKTS